MNVFRLERQRRWWVGVPPCALLCSAVALASTPPSFVWPVSGRLSSDYGPRNGRPHVGVDVAAEHGAEVRAAADGWVLFAGERGDYGLLVELDHGQGWVTRYAHLDGLALQAGAWVWRGDLLGRVGATGNATGAHLHLEVRREGQAVDPLQVLPW